MQEEEIHRDENLTNIFRGQEHATCSIAYKEPKDCFAQSGVIILILILFFCFLSYHAITMISDSFFLCILDSIE